MIRPPSILPAVGLFALCALGVEVAAAQNYDAAAGEALFQEGRRLMKSRDFAQACAKFEESQRMDPAPGTIVNLADCEEQLGRTASAWQHWRAAADELSNADKRRATAVSRASILEKSLARLSISLAPSVPPDILIKRDGVILGPASMGVGLPIDPGHHQVVVSASGRETRELDVNIRPKEQRALVVEPGPAVEPPKGLIAVEPGRNPSAASPAEPSAKALSSEGSARSPVSSGRERSTPVVGYVLLGGGALAIGAGAFFGAQALAARRDASAACPDIGGAHRCWSTASAALDRDQRYSLYADVGVGVGALAAGTALYLLLKPQSEAPATSAAFAPLPGGGEVHLARSF